MGKLFIVGTGPGNIELMTPEAVAAIREADVIVGYKNYLDLISDLIVDKVVYESSMMQEVQRAGKAIEYAEEGKIVAVVSGGDAGIYAMAGLMLEMLAEKDKKIKTRVIPGISALNGCAAKLGAPLMHDFATISLSDLLTPWEVIEKRIHAVASSDFVIVIYNPRSKKRTWQIEKTCEIVSGYRDRKSTPVGVVTGSSRDNEVISVSMLDKIDFTEINMQSTVIIGNSSTFIWNGYIITPRGYKNKYVLDEK